jgi:hypothetical protein
LPKAKALRSDVLIVMITAYGDAAAKPGAKGKRLVDPFAVHESAHWTLRDWPHFDRRPLLSGNRRKCRSKATAGGEAFDLKLT